MQNILTENSPIHNPFLTFRVVVTSMIGIIKDSFVVKNGPDQENKFQH